MRYVLGLLFVFVLSACGDDGDSGGDAVTEDAPASETVTVDIAGFAFAPRELEVPAGTELVWTNSDDFAHTARADEGAFDTGDLAPGVTSEPVVVDEPGTYSYVCAIHNSMTGTITVTG